VALCVGLCAYAGSAQAETQLVDDPFWFWQTELVTGGWGETTLFEEPAASEPTAPEATAASTESTASGEAAAEEPAISPEPTLSEAAAAVAEPAEETAPLALSAATLPATPVLSVSGGVVHWTAIGSETAYKVAVSTAARGDATRITTYLTVPRVSGTAQSYTPSLAPGQTVYVGVSADGGLSWSAQEAVVHLPVAPELSVAEGAVWWSPIAAETSYKVALSTAPRGSATRTTTYVTVARVAGTVQSYTPVLAPGQTVYVGVSADGGATWSEEEVAVTAPPLVPQTPPAPVLSVNGDTISWAAIPGVSSYKLATILNPTTTRETTYTIVTGTSVTPPVLAGKTVNYGLQAAAPVEGPWAHEVTIVYPSSGEGGTTSTPPPSTAGKIIGTNDGAGWGSLAAEKILGGHITWDRVEIGSSTNTLAKSLAAGFKALAIVGNTDNGTPLSQVEPTQWGTGVVSQLRANPGIAIAEAGNEMYLKGGVANPVRYGKMYLAAVNAMKAAGIHTPLLFNMFGDYPIGTWSSPTGWSQDAHGGGWLHDAVAGVPGLAAAILANGISTHPYGALGEDSADDGGVLAVAAQEAVAQTVLGAIPRVYITEFGYDVSRCGVPYGACSQQEQASKMQAAYKVFLADAHVAGVWWYQSHDDSTGQFGFMNNDSTLRPSFGVLSSFAVAQGQ
jgi:hypothetical protein